MAYPTVRGAWVEEAPATVAPVSWVICVAWNLLLGGLFLAGGPDRITSPSFATIRDLGGHLVVGSLFMVVGIAMAVAVAGSTRLMAATLAIGALLSVALAAGFLTALLTEPPATYPGEPRAALIGPLLPLFPAAVHWIRARYYWHLGASRA